MQTSGVGKHVLGALALAVVIYAAGFGFDQHLRARRGPWMVTFTADMSGDAAIIVNQPKLNINNLKIVFAGERMTRPTATVAFDAPQRPVPTGKVKFEDLTYLPGTVTLDLFDHEIELIPRTLYINRKPRPWKSNETITLTAADKPASLPEPKPKRKY
ncbi:MAG TPA: hypothetical protein VJW76_12155 [Verrucomicrobiae bacterium]|nr:hypothetical protein [Verrucomicrobiae bacterium]